MKKIIIVLKSDTVIRGDTQVLIKYINNKNVLKYVKCIS